MLVVFALFVLPSRWDWLKFFTERSSDDLPEEKSEGLITWEVISQRIPFIIIFLFGGGYALVRGGQESGMSNMLGTHFSLITDLPLPLLLFLICLIMQVLAEFIADVAIVYRKFCRSSIRFSQVQYYLSFNYKSF